MLVELTHKLNLDPELPDEYKEKALELGEDPNKVPAYLDEFRNIIFGNYFLFNKNSQFN